MDTGGIRTRTGAAAFVCPQVTEIFPHDESRGRACHLGSLDPSFDLGFHSCLDKRIEDEVCYAGKLKVDRRRVAIERWDLLERQW